MGWVLAVNQAAGTNTRVAGNFTQLQEQYTVAENNTT
jgi:hypothetical protein